MHPIFRSSGVLLTATVLSTLALGGCAQNDRGTTGSAPRSSTAAAEAQSGELAIPADADEETKKAYLLENAIAVCMRGKGFTYTPHIRSRQQVDNPVDGQDYRLAKQYRQKYGFGIFAGAVYPDNPDLIGSRANVQGSDSNPDNAYLDELSPGQRKTYEEALGGKIDGRRKKVLTEGCAGEADVKVNGPKKPAAEQKREQDAERERQRAAGQALNGDPRLVVLAQQYASCLSQQGITVTTTQPTSIGDMVKFSVSATLPPEGIQDLDRNTALAKLTHEIDLAKKDLECGKNFRAAYFPKFSKNPYYGDMA